MNCRELTYSIVIPHRNIPVLLQRCLDSIPSRDDLQIIVVDDDSDPDTVDFRHFPGSDREDVEIIFTKKRRGAGYARNVGIDRAAGKWLLFADADDFFHEGMLEMLDRWKDSDNHIVFFQTDSVDSETLEDRDSRLGYVDYSDLDLVRYYNVVPWGKMILSSFVRMHRIRYDEVEASNDVMFSLKCGHFAGKVSQSQDVLYCATCRNGSLVYSDDPKKLVSRLNVAYRYNRFCRKRHLDHRQDPEHYISLLKDVDRFEYYWQCVRYLWKGDSRLVRYFVKVNLKRMLGIKTS